MNKKSRSQGTSAVKDLTPHNTKDVKGGVPASTPNLYQAACKGTHIPEVVIE